MKILTGIDLLQPHSSALGPQDLYDPSMILRLFNSSPNHSHFAFFSSREDKTRHFSRHLRRSTHLTRRLSIFLRQRTCSYPLVHDLALTAASLYLQFSSGSYFIFLISTYFISSRSFRFQPKIYYSSGHGIKAQARQREIPKHKGLQELNLVLLCAHWIDSFSKNLLHLASEISLFIWFIWFFKMVVPRRFLFFLGVALC